ncbi:hypothetical protein [Paenibacillus sp. RC67]|uniref:hypothetical protein n=1 Tax=Paenibacillus sp. RC67 TaxID=3039392 RepID=UPI0024ADC03D|nr:hypothetical protein [Paenibacillus sp. RC67]
MRKSTWIIVCVTTIAVFFAGCGNSGKSAVPTPAPSSTPAPLATITKEKYDKINIGMTYEEVKSIVGGEGKLITETGDKATPEYTATYQYTAEGNPNGQAKITFRSNKCTSKSEASL